MARGVHGVQLVISDAHTGLKPAVGLHPAWEPAGIAGSTSGDPCARHGGDRPSEVRVVGGWPGRWSTATESR